jgi:hypothetical protein
MRIEYPRNTRLRPKRAWGVIKISAFFRRTNEADCFSSAYGRRKREIRFV